MAVSKRAILLAQATEIHGLTRVCSLTIECAVGSLCGIAAADICWKENLPQRGVVINQPCLVPAQR